MEKSKVLIVEDDREVLKMLKRGLGMFGYECLSSDESTQALEVADKGNPDLFLLDMIMPKINGIELCAHLKTRGILQDKPVIFLSAVDTTEVKVRAFETGAVDYITKPADLKEIATRIDSHLCLFKARKRLEEEREEMSACVTKLKKSLMPFSTEDSSRIFLRGLAYEIDNPAIFIKGNIGMLRKFLNVFQDTLNDLKDKKYKKFSDFIFTEIPNILEDIDYDVKRIKKIVNSLKSFAGEAQSNKEPVKVIECIDLALENCKDVLKSGNVSIEKSIERDDIYIMANAEEIKQALMKLISNALDAMAKVKKPLLKISALSKNDIICIIISDNGIGIQPNTLFDIWTPFFTTKHEDKRAGLGLCMARSIINDHKGSISVSESKDGGAKFIVKLPTCG